MSAWAASPAPAGGGVEQQLAAQVETVSKWVDVAMQFAVTYGFQILGALVFLLIGLKIAGWGGRRVTGMLEFKEIDHTLARFIGNIVKVIAVVFLVIITLGNFGISIAPLIALAGASAFGATVAIQGPLSNYGAGLSIILGRTFAVGDTITVNNKTSGVVEEVKQAATLLRGEDGELITIPNKEVVGRVIVNSNERRVVQTRVSIGADQDTDKALAAIRAAVATLSELDGAPPPQIGVHDFTYGGIVLGVRFWVKSQSYFQARYAVNGVVLAALKDAGIEMMPAGALAVAASSLSADEEDHEEDKAI